MPARRNDAEFRLTCLVADLLRLLREPNVYFSHLPFGEARSVRTGARLKRMGTIAGAGDFLIVVGGVATFLELKADKGRQSPDQRLTQTAFEDAGGVYKLARGYAEAVAALVEIGAIRPVTEDGRFRPREAGA